jgi:hypothetical protein
MEKFEVKFKKGVYGFVYDSVHKQVNKVFTKPLTDEELKLTKSVVGTYNCVFTDIKSINEVFKFNTKNIGFDINKKGLSKVVKYTK